MTNNMNSETKILLVFGAALVVVIVLASLALRQPPAEIEQVATADLPDCTTCVDPQEPTIEACLASGGTVKYRRFTECFDQPDVHDACGFGVPCFTNADGYYCRESKDPYCHCESDDQCPDGHYCQFDTRSKDGKTFEPILSTGQCWKETVESGEPVKSLRTAPYPL
jgi:hypothetical protein